MIRTRRKFTTSFKTKVVLEAIKERLTISELAAKYELHPNQINTWKKEFLTNAEKALGGDTSQADVKEIEQQKEELYKQIGKLKVENDWLKKKLL